MAVVKIIMLILGGMGTLLFGMRMLSDNLTRLAHVKLKNLLGKTARNRFACVGIGAAVTLIAQNSGFTTVMVVGLVNAGIMSLFQATAMIMGANIGTTFAAWLIALGGGKFSFTVFFLAFAAAGAFITVFAKNDKLKSIGNAIGGLGLLFVGLNVMSSALSFEPGSAEYNAISSFLSGLDTPFLPIIFMLVGVAVTALVQSSTAVNAIVITMAAAGLFGGLGGGNALFFIIIGSNIGTCITALISSIGANVNAKRAALVHFMFNFFGAIIFMIIMLSWKGFAATLIVPAFPDNTEFQITLFHTLFNVVCTALFLPFVTPFAKLANILVPDKTRKSKKEKRLIGEADDRLLRSPSVALAYLYSEIGNVFSYSMETLNGAFDAFINKDVSAKEETVKRNKEIYAANKTAVEYLVKLSAASPAMNEEQTIPTLHYVLNDIMRVGEIADNITKYTSAYVNDNLEFSAEFLEMLQTMRSQIRELFDKTLEIYNSRDLSGLSEIDALEEEIDNCRRSLVSAHIARLNDGKCQPANSGVFINLVGNLERAADHITYIAHYVEQCK